MAPSQFCTHDNGGRPFRITLGEDNRSLEVEVSSNNEPEVYKPWKTFEYRQIFIGRGEYDVISDDDRFYGNSVLIQVEELSYLYIGDSIFTFTASAPITKYVATVCNSDVVYSYAVDETGRYYFFEAQLTLDEVFTRPVLRRFPYLESVPDGSPSQVFEYFYESSKRYKFYEGKILHDRIW